jgi:hypothetical protein
VAGWLQVGHGELDELGVAVAGDVRTITGRVEDQTVVGVAAGHGGPPGDEAAAGVDDGDLVAGLHVDQDAVAGGVVGDVASVPPSATVSTIWPVPASTTVSLQPVSLLIQICPLLGA